MSDTIRVLIVERSPLLRRGIASYLTSDNDLQLVGSVGSAEEGFTTADEQLPDVVLVGTTLSDSPGLNAATDFHRKYASTAVIVVAAQDSDDEFFAALRSGAAAYCGQEVDENTLVTLIKRAATGEYVINEQLLDRPNVAARVLEQFPQMELDALSWSVGRQRDTKPAAVPAAAGQRTRGRDGGPDRHGRDHSYHGGHCADDAKRHEGF